MNAVDEIAALSLKVQQLEADLLAADEICEVLEAERDEAVQHADERADEQAYERAWGALAEFVADVRRGIRTLDEFEAVCS